MTISKNQNWESQKANLPHTKPEAAFNSDFDCAQYVLGSDHVPVVILNRGSDLMASLGGKSVSDASNYLLCDLGIVDTGSEKFGFISHVSLGKPFATSELNVAMNATHYGSWLLGRKAHPNDGLIDFITGELALRQRQLAKSKAANGSFMPHPDISYKRLSGGQLTSRRRAKLLVDGVAVGRFGEVKVTCRPDAVVVAT